MCFSIIRKYSFQVKWFSELKTTSKYLPVSIQFQFTELLYFSTHSTEVNNVKSKEESIQLKYSLFAHKNLGTGTVIFCFLSQKYSLVRNWQYHLLLRKSKKSHLLGLHWILVIEQTTSSSLYYYNSRSGRNLGKGTVIFCLLSHKRKKTDHVTLTFLLDFWGDVNQTTNTHKKKY